MHITQVFLGLSGLFIINKVPPPSPGSHALTSGTSPACLLPPPPDPPGLSTGTAAVPLAGAYSLRLQSSCDLLVLFAQLIIQTLTEKDATSK